uniref:Ionotropic glutamate receptor C-terminal domain-containing protein n=1 Tax=Anopheles epiroticus TaxID=199890 RepID=A0A182P5M7_9DIPT
MAVQYERVLFDLLKWQHRKTVYVFHCFNQKHGSCGLISSCHKTENFLRLLNFVLSALIHALHSVRKSRPESMSFLNVATFREPTFMASLQSVHVSVGFMADLNCEGIEGVLQALSIGSWSNTSGLTIWDKRCLYERRQNLLGMQQSGIIKGTEDEHWVTLVQTQMEKTSGSLYYDTAEGIGLIQSGRTAFLCDISRAYLMIQSHFADEEQCAVQEIPLIGKRSTHLALSKDSPLKELIRVTVHKLAGNGLMQYERKLCYANKPRCAENEVKMPEVNLDQVSSVLAMLLCAMVSSIAVLLLEITVSKVWPRRRRH